MSRTTRADRRDGGRKKKHASRAGLEKARIREEARLERQKAFEEERSRVRIITGDTPSQMPKQKKTFTQPAPVIETEQEEVSTRLKRISLKDITRYAKSSAKSYDAAYLERMELEKNHREVLSKIDSLKTPKDADDATREELKKQRAALRKDRDALARKITVADESATALEKACDEYIYVISLISKEDETDYRKQPRLNERNIDLTEEDKIEILERLLAAGKVTKKEEKPAPAPAVEEEPEAEVQKTLRVIDSPVSNTKKETPAVVVKKEKDPKLPLKITVSVLVLAIIIFAFII